MDMLIQIRYNHELEITNVFGGQADLEFLKVFFFPKLWQFFAGRVACFNVCLPFTV